MKRSLLILASLFLYTGQLCLASPTASEVKSKIAKKIWQNECAGTVKGLVSWNHGENFPSLGIGHFIWFPAGVSAPFEESFPAFVAYAKAKGVDVPSFFNGPAPWKTKAQWQAQAEKGGMINQMRQWLSQNTDVQADFIINRSMAALQRMQKLTKNPKNLASKYYAVASTPNGMYALIDYVNFKGEGINPQERYQGHGWGLLQVLEEMPAIGKGPGAAKEFSQAAKRVLGRRIQLSPPNRGESRWKQGWFNRCDTYAKPL